MIKKIADFIARHPKTVVIVASVLLIPAVIGYISTKINYDILTYLPEQLESVQGGACIKAVVLRYVRGQPPYLGE